ncbi:group II intron reverse transcriptase/maturase [Lacrimispora sp.]|uniref:group II intron reverse transcriptase/maturase n=1 Tax=Lacrimispora sp. TaxID=2719234 RepID=UPI0028A8D103|nr:group II intron reverse transcriptase/maturase [Lacrimispora sp.]
MKPTENSPKRAKSRHAEYYDYQQIQDELYAKSQRDEIFGHLMELIISQENIKMGYRNIKKNHGSHTAGTDKKTIDDLAELPEREFVAYIQKLFTNYQPKPVKRVEIPKPDGKTRPLGIPCIQDRVVQQCVLQVLEPIMEAKFSDHSYGFRPCRSTEHAIAETYRLMQQSHLHYVVDVDIKGFFDHVNHRKLMRQLWTLGIHDTKLLQIIKAMLKAPIRFPNGKLVYPTEGTPQGGLCSPLLANVMLNELDWWIMSQWELQSDHMKNPLKPQFNKKGKRDLGGEFTALRKSNLKEMYIVRYADDFKIFCRDYKTAQKTFVAVKQWIKERLHLEISPEKSKVTNLRKRYSEFLGFKLKVHQKGKKYVVKSHISDKAVLKSQESLSKQVKEMQKPKDSKELYQRAGKYNSMVIGMQNYYSLATNASLDFGKIGYKVKALIKNRLNTTKTGEIGQKYIRDRYGGSGQIRWVQDIPIVPIAYVKCKNPMNKKRKVCPYTEAGRQEIHAGLRIDVEKLRQLMLNPVMGQSIEYNDNRISLYAAQYGKCAVTGRILEVEEIHCHHKIPCHLGGGDSYQNLIIVQNIVHRLIHASVTETIEKLINQINLTNDQLQKVNKLRAAAGLEAVTAVP